MASVKACDVVFCTPYNHILVLLRLYKFVFNHVVVMIPGC